MMARLSKRSACLGALIAASSLALSLSMAADGASKHPAREVDLDDGAVCCAAEDRFLFDGDRVLVLTGRAGMLRSEHRGEGWQRRMDGLVGPNGASPHIAAVCQSQSDPRVVYALTGLAGDGGEPSPFNGVFSSDDFGSTWRRRAPATGFPFITSCDVDPDDPRTVYILNFNLDFVFEVWKSTDGGRTIRLLDTPPTTFGSVRVVRNAVYLLDGFEGRLYTSIDGGADFHAVPTPPGLVGDFDASPDGGAIFVHIFDEAFNPVGVFRSIDGGISYVPVDGLPNGFLSMAFHPTDPSRVYTSDGLLRVSINGGASFTLLPASNDPRFFGAVPIGGVGVDGRGSVYLNTAAGPFRTDDDGLTFRSLLNGFHASSVQDLAFDADGKLLVGVLHTQVLYRQTRGQRFQAIGHTPLIDFSFIHDAAVVAASPTDANVILVAVTAQGLFRTENGGRTWTLSELPDSLAIFFNARMTFASASRVYLVAPYFVGAGLYRSDDAGRTFTRLSNLTLGAIAVDPTNPDVLYLGDHGGTAGLFRSMDGGQTLEDLRRPGSFSALAVDWRNPQVIYAGEHFGQVIRSRDGGRTFAPASKGLAGAGVHGLGQDARGTLFVWLRGGGLFASDDGAATWKPVDTREALERSGVEVGRGTLVADPRRPGRVYLGHAGLLQVDDGDHDH